MMRILTTHHEFHMILLNTFVIDFCSWLTNDGPITS